MGTTTTARQLDAWETPGDYGGYDPIGHYGVFAKHRDSDVLTRSNWDAACERMAKAAGIDAVPNLADTLPDNSVFFGGDPDAAPDVYWWEAGHWAVGWVQYLMVKPTAPVAVLDEAEAIQAALKDYPILDEDLFSQMEWDEMVETWSRESVRDRVDYFLRPAIERGANVSIFAARRDTTPSDDQGIIDDMLRS